MIEELFTIERNLWNQLMVRCAKIRTSISLESLINLMYLPKDASSLGVIRFLYGLLMVCDIFEERGGAVLDYKWGEPNVCRFPLFSILKPFDLKYMALVYGIMWIGAWGIMLGYKFKYSCTIFAISYWYVLLLDKTTWNNHSYLYGVLALLFIGTCANRWCSLDAYFNNNGKDESVPNWNYFILKFQIFILYFYAGLKKTDMEWLDGYSMTDLGKHWVFEPFKIILTTEQIDILIVHWFGFLLDLTIGFWLLFNKTRPYALFFCSCFHIMNSRLFRIGMFPYVGLATLPIFCECNWPKTLVKTIKEIWCLCVEKMFKTGNENFNEKGNGNAIKNETGNEIKKAIGNINDKGNVNLSENTNGSKAFTPKEITYRHKFVFCTLLTHCVLQITLPYSHFITKGYNNWTNGLYGYSWDMMVHSWNNILTVVKVVDNKTGRVNYLNTYAWVENERWSKHGDMIVQYAQCLKDNLIKEYKDAHGNKAEIKKFITSEDISIYVDVWCSLNGRFQQRMYDPTYDLLKANWSPFKKVEYLLPLLTEYSDFRERMFAIEKEIYEWSNVTEVLFVADFPGLELENYITDDNTNVTLTIIEGTVKYVSELVDDVIILNKGDSIKVPTEVFHKIKTVSNVPSCFMYTYVNETPTNGTSSMNGTNKIPSPFPILENSQEYYKNLKQFLINVLNGLASIIFNVPMTRRRQDEK